MRGALVSRDVSIGDISRRSTVYADAEANVVMDFEDFESGDTLIPQALTSGLVQLLNIPSSLASAAQANFGQGALTRIHLVCKPSQRALPTVRRTPTCLWPAGSVPRAQRVGPCPETFSASPPSQLEPLSEPMSIGVLSMYFFQVEHACACANAPNCTGIVTKSNLVAPVTVEPCVGVWRLEAQAYGESCGAFPSPYALPLPHPPPFIQIP